MGRTKGSKNKPNDFLPYYSKLPTKERIELIARIIVDWAEADQHAGAKLLSHLDRRGYGRPKIPV